MKKNFQFYKNIILVVASALTLIAVTFAWFTTSTHNGISSIKRNIGEELIKVDFYQNSGSTLNPNYERLDGEITLDGAVSGDYSQYKMVVTTLTADKLKLSFGIDDLPASMNPALKQAVCIKYSIYKATKNSNGTYTEIGGPISSTTNNSYVPLSELSNGVILNPLSLANYQSSDKDYFVVYYEIGIAEGASNVQGMSSSLGTVRFSAQVA